MTPLHTQEEQNRWLATIDRRVSSTSVIIEDLEGRLLIVKAHYKDYWTLPGGMVDKGESPLQAGIREVEEEVGLSISSEDAAFYSAIYRKSTRYESYQFVFRITSRFDSASQSIVLQASEIDAYEWVTKEQVLSGDRQYAKIIERWAKGDIETYAEQTFID